MANRYSSTPYQGAFRRDDGQQTGGGFQSPADAQSQGGSWFDQQPPPNQMHTMSAPGQTDQTGQTGMPGVYGQVQGAVGGGGGPTPGNEQQWFMQLVGNRPWNQQTFNELAPTLKQYGFNITPPNAVGDQTKIQLPTGEWVRVGFGEGHPVWIPQGNAGGGGTNFGEAGPNPSGTGINSPWAIPPPFQNPSVSDMMADPGYQARLQEGQLGLQRSAAAKGSLLSGGFQKAFDKYNQTFASNEYGQAYNRALGNYQQNFATQSVTPWNRYQQVLDRGLTATLGSKTPVPLSPG